MSKLREPVYGTAARIIAHAPMLRSMIDQALAALRNRPEGPIPSPGKYLASINYTHELYLETQAKAATRGGEIPEILQSLAEHDIETRSDLMTELSHARNELEMCVKDAEAVLSGEPESAESFYSRIANAAWTAELAVNRGHYQYKGQRGMRTHIEVDVHPVDLRLLAMVATQVNQPYNTERFPSVDAETLETVLSKIAADPRRVLPKRLGAMTTKLVADIIDHFATTTSTEIICPVGGAEYVTSTVDGPVYNPAIVIEFNAGTVYAAYANCSLDGISLMSGREVRLERTLPATVMQSRIGASIEAVVDHPLYRGLNLDVLNVTYPNEGMVLIIGNPDPQPVEIKDYVSEIATGYSSCSVPSDYDFEMIQRRADVHPRSLRR